MVSTQLVAAVLTLLPAMGLLWLYLGRYEGYFEQNRLFFALVVGLFVGTAVRWLEVYLFRFESPGSLQPDGHPFTTGTLVYSFAYTTLGLALMESMGKTAVLGLKKFRTRKDSAYYGTALGCGFGAMWVIQVMAAHIAAGEGGALRTDGVAVVFDLFLFLLGMGLLAAQVASAVWIGKASGEGKLWRGAIHGSLWMAPGLAMFWLFLNLGDQVLPALGALAWGIFALVFADRRILLVIVPPEVREMVRRERRREARKQNRD